MGSLGAGTGGFPRGIPLIADYDDAVFHRYDQHCLMAVRALLGRKIDAVMQRANLVLAGNEYLAKRAAYKLERSEWAFCPPSSI